MGTKVDDGGVDLGAGMADCDAGGVRWESGNGGLFKVVAVESSRRG